MTDPGVTLLMTDEQGENFWHRFMTVDDTRLSYLNIKTKAQSMQWLKKEEGPPVKAQAISSTGKSCGLYSLTVKVFSTLITFQRNEQSMGRTTVTC